jgi:hypothetical protein
MVKVTVANFKSPEDRGDTVLSIEGSNHYNASSVFPMLNRLLAAAKAVWPDDEQLKRVHIVELKDDK